MIKIASVLFLFMALCCCAQAQVIANFTVDKTGGCSPLLVQFTNTTTGASATASYHWDFDNGNTSTLKSPGAIFTEEKSYSVKLTVKDGNQSTTKTTVITVYKKPTIDFAASLQKGCAPLPVNFTANATAGDGSIAGYEWDFGDGSTDKSTSALIQHTYNSAQNATISVTVSNSFGCYETLTKTNVVDIKESLIADFSAQKQVLCRETDPVQLNNESKGPGTLTYLWEFGDGKTSTEKNPQHVFNKRGIYTVTLTVNSNEGCTSSLTATNYLNVANFTSDFTVPTPVCQGAWVELKNNSTPNPASTTWEVDGQPAYAYTNSLFTTFYTTGTHTVKLQNTFGDCIDDITKTIVVKAPPVLKGFIAEPESECGAPVLVNFKDTTAGAVKWKWNFDNYNTMSTLQAPSQLYGYDNGFWVHLEVENADGCKAAIGQPLYISKPSVVITSPQQAGSGEVLSCGPGTFTFQANSSQPITSYRWNFGDGATSTEAAPAHTYSTAGDYRVSLQYTTTSGCTGTAIMNYSVVIRNKVKADFEFSQTQICGNTPVTITNKSGGTVYYQWDLGNGYFSAHTGQYHSFTHQFQQEGVYDIGLIATDMVCADTIVKKAYVKVSPPFPKIAGFTNTCEGTRGLVSLQQTSRQAETWHWDFGDGTTQSFTTDQREVQHTYTKTGMYKVVLTTTNGQCTVKDSLNVPVLLKQSPVLTADKAEVCSRDDFLKLTVSNLEKNPNPYSWYYGYGYGDWHHTDGSWAPGNASAGDLSQIPYTMTLWNFNPGKEGLRTVVTSYYFGCRDTTNWIPLKIKGPIASFRTVSKPCQLGNVVFLKDNSVGQNGVPIRQWEWNFGDGQVATYTNNAEISHTYVWPGSYWVTLKTTDADGCSAFYQSYVDAQDNALKASFTSSATTISPGTTITFQNTSATSEPSHTQYKWIFSDGTEATTHDAAKSYSQPGVYTVKLVATNTTRGCADTATVTITVKYVNAAFTFNSAVITASQCPPVRVQFTNISSNISRIEWDFGDGTTSRNFNPSHLYTNPGKYIITVKTYSDNGTVYTTVDSVFIKAPTATLAADRYSGCTAQTISFSADGNDAEKYWWDFGDGTVTQATANTISHFYQAAGSYQPKLMVSNASGCTAAVLLDDKIVIDALQAGIKDLPSYLCTPKTILFEPTTSGVSTHTNLNYHWNFGTGVPGDTSNLEKASFSFTQPGKYTVRLTVESNTGCRKEVTKTIEAFEGLGAMVTGPDEICQESTVQFTGATLLAGQPQWTWIFHDGTTVSAQNPPAKTYNQAGNYPVKLVVNNNGCQDTVTKMLTVNAKPVNILTTQEAIVCRGSAYTLSATGGTTYQWSPATGLSATTGNTVLAAPSQDITYSVTATTEKGCSHTESIRLKVAQPFTVQLAPETQVCTGSTVSLSASGAASYQWIGNTAGLSSTTISNPIARPVANTSYTVVGKDAFQCFTDTATIKVSIQPLPTVDAGPALEVLAGTGGRLQPTTSNDVVSWNWTPGDYLSCTTCPAPETKPFRSLTYTVTVQNSAGCSASDTVSVGLLCSGSRIFIPTSFTPNADGKNDRFRIRAEGIKEVKSFRIYNRWGELIFERTRFAADDVNGAWDGKLKGQRVPEGTYVYVAELSCNDQVFQHKGTVTVVY
ncbi:MAG TPA: PKD domain-containing protein [Flavisolibacter sp.]|jgi:gliding motility-associated-like protein|nr:PKD domain-containing protein [Flavisolibacter sp.]